MFLQTLGIQGEVIATPGHSDDSIFLVLDDGIAFVGYCDDTIKSSWNILEKHNDHTIYYGH